MLTLQRTLTAAALLAAGSAALLGAGPAAAQAPDSPTPAPAAPAPTADGTPQSPATTAATVKVKGTSAKVTWPISADVAVEVRAGARLRVEVKQPGKNATKLTVRFAQSKPTAKVIRSKTLRRGIAAFTVPEAAGDYVLSLRAGGKELRRSVVTVPSKSAQQPGTVCAKAAPNVSFGAVTWAEQPETGSVAVESTFANLGPGCLVGLPHAYVERAVDGVWTDVSGPSARPAILIPVLVGAADKAYATIPRDSPAGRYRLIVKLTDLNAFYASPTNVDPAFTASATVEFDYPGLG